MTDGTTKASKEDESEFRAELRALARAKDLAALSRDGASIAMIEDHLAMLDRKAAEIEGASNGN